MWFDPRRLFSNQFVPGGFRASVFTLLSGSTFALALGYLARPFLTRLYTPADFGLADVFIALVGILMPVASLRYEDALMLPEDDRDAASILGLAALLTSAFAALMLLLIVPGVALASRMGAPDLAAWLWLIPPTLLILRASKLAEMWLTRQKRFKPVSAGQVVQSSTMVAVRVGAALPPWHAGPGGLIGGFVAGHAVAALLLLTAALRHGAHALGAAFRTEALRATASRYRRFAVFSMPSTLLGALMSRLPFLLLLFFFDRTIVGHFGLAFNAVLVPLSLLGGAVAQVFFVHAAEAVREDTLAPLTTTVHRRLVMAGLYPTLALLLAGPDVFAVVFSETWRTAGTYVQYLAPWLFFTALSVPLTRLFDVLERQRLDLMTSLILFTVLLSALLVGGFAGDPERCLLLLGLAGGATRCGQMLLLLRLGGVSWGSLVRPFARYTAFSLPGLLLTVAALSLHHPVLTTLAAALGGVLYVTLLLLRDGFLPPRR